MNLDYEDGYSAGRTRHRPGATGVAVVNLLFGLVRPVTALGTAALLAAPFALVGFGLAAQFPFLGAAFSLTRLVASATGAYLFFAALYWLKGVGIGLRTRRGGLWLVPLALCVGFACLLPGLLVQLAVSHQFPAVGLAWSWSLGAAFALLAYRRYHFTENSAPAVIHWSYQSGYRWATR